ncbi:MAG TPA: colicin immunity domain-containing protein [Methylomirabilota bacterium]|nr:colicin immunity domain-containing protein [Methylomirabilota bacterium]
MSACVYSQLMKDFLDGRVTAAHYCRNYFDLGHRRVVIPNEEVERVTRQAFWDAEDYEADPSLRARNPKWIDEAQLKERVARSLRELESLGYPAGTGGNTPR